MHPARWPGAFIFAEGKIIPFTKGRCFTRPSFTKGSEISRGFINDLSISTQYIRLRKVFKSHGNSYDDLSIDISFYDIFCFINTSTPQPWTYLNFGRKRF